MEIEKAYFTLPEVLKRWSMSETDLVYLAENDELRLSIRINNMPLEFGNDERTQDGESSCITFEQKCFTGLVDLHAEDVSQLFRCSEIYLCEFRTPQASFAKLNGDVDPILVMIGDLLLRREERDRFEAAHKSLSIKTVPMIANFHASSNYHEVSCNGHDFHLGPIQAAIVRELHKAHCRGEQWQFGKKVLSAAGSKSLKIADVFKSKKQWRSLIESDGRGKYRLKLNSN